MELERVMEQRSFVVVGDTLNEEKYAAKIKRAMLEHGYQVQCVGKELPSLNDVTGEIDIVDLCIRADRGLELLRSCEKLLRALSSSRVPPVKNWFSIFRSTKSLISMDAFCLD